MKKLNFSESIGWYGFIAVFLGYLLVSFDFVNPKNLIYLGLNITGSIGMSTITFRKRAWSLFIFYTIWTIIGAVSLIRI